MRHVRQAGRAWNRRVNRDRVKIAWKFDRQDGAPEVRLQLQIFQAVKDLVPPL